MPSRCAAGSASSGPTGSPCPPTSSAPLDPDAVAMVLEQVHPRPCNADELHDLLLSLVAGRPVAEWVGWFDELAADGPGRMLDGCWVATERRPGAEALGLDDDAAAACVRGPPPARRTRHGGGSGGGRPVAGGRAQRRTVERGAGTHSVGTTRRAGFGHRAARRALVRPQPVGPAARRQPQPPARHGGPRTHRRLRALPHAVAARDAGHRLEGRAGLLEVLEQLQGIEAPASEWEAQILPARVEGYDLRWLDELCLSGEIVWGRLTPRAERPGRSGTPSPATPLAFVVRDDLVSMLRAVRAGAGAPEPDVGAGGRRPGGAACPRRLLPSRAGPAHRAPPGGGRRGTLGPGRPGPGDRGRLLGRAVAALGARPLADAHGTAPVGPTGPPAARPAGSGIGEGRWSLLPGPEVLGVPPVGDGVLTPGNEELAETVALPAPGALGRRGVGAVEP